MLKHNDHFHISNKTLGLSINSPVPFLHLWPTATAKPSYMIEQPYFLL